MFPRLFNHCFKNVVEMILKTFNNVFMECLWNVKWKTIFTFQNLFQRRFRNINKRIKNVPKDVLILFLKCFHDFVQDVSKIFYRFLFI